jgi:hypothetical protein
VSNSSLAMLINFFPLDIPRIMLHFEDDSHFKGETEKKSGSCMIIRFNGRNLFNAKSFVCTSISSQARLRSESKFIYPFTSFPCSTESYYVHNGFQIDLYYTLEAGQKKDRTLILTNHT